jgi:hypothetical protein
MGARSVNPSEHHEQRGNRDVESNGMQDFRRTTRAVGGRLPRCVVFRSGAWERYRPRSERSPHPPSPVWSLRPCPNVISERSPLAASRPWRLISQSLRSHFARIDRMFASVGGRGRNQMTPGVPAGENRIKLPKSASSFTGIRSVSMANRRTSRSVFPARPAARASLKVAHSCTQTESPAESSPSLPIPLPKLLNCAKQKISKMFG